MYEILEILLFFISSFIAFIFPILILELIKTKRELKRLKRIDEYFRVEEEAEEKVEAEGEDNS